MRAADRTACASDRNRGFHCGPGDDMISDEHMVQATAPSPITDLSERSREIFRLIVDGYVARDNMCGGYRVTRKAGELNSGYAGISMVIDAAVDGVASARTDATNAARASRRGMGPPDGRADVDCTPKLEGARMDLAATATAWSPPDACRCRSTIRAS